MQTTPTLPTTPDSSPSTSAAPPPVGPARRGLALLAVLATLPYLTLKLHWLTGGRAGLGDPAFGQSTVMYVLNGLTMLLDVVALVLAVVFLTRRGLRAPAWLVLPPMWVGAGLLGQILVALPVSAILNAVSTPSAPTTGEPPPIAEWVFTMVYAGFGLLGVGLLGSFAIYAWQRWGGRPLGAPTAGQSGTLVAAAGLVLVAAVVHLLLSEVPLSSRLLDLVVALTAAISLTALASPAVRSRGALVAVVIAFVGTGAMAAWGTYLGVIVLVPNDLVGQDAVDWPTVAASALRLVAGALGVGALAARISRR